MSSPDPHEAASETHQKEGVHNFPYYLKGSVSGTEMHDWIGKKLQSIREGSKTQATPEMKLLETGNFSINLGHLHDLLKTKYRTSLLELLEAFNAQRPAGKKEEHFERDYDYAVTVEKPDISSGSAPKRHGKLFSKKSETHMFTGGVENSYKWAVPLRRLKNQQMTMEFLELAPRKKLRADIGMTPSSRLDGHDGAELIHVLHGEVKFSIKTGKNQRATERYLNRSDTVHFHSCHEHFVANWGPTCALLLLIRSTSENETPPLRGAERSKGKKKQSPKPRKESV